MPIWLALGHAAFASCCLRYFLAGRNGAPPALSAAGLRERVSGIVQNRMLCRLKVLGFVLEATLFLALQALTHLHVPEHALRYDYYDRDRESLHPCRL